ncbi:MAG: hypothetical protein O9327_02235 [Polaromonas sp.]|nr:hypothetical protein [Polaromonas sp.]
MSTNPTQSTTPVTFNRAQQILLKTYDDGEFAHVLEQTTTEAVMADLEMDGLLRFLFLELADSEGCEDLDEAEDRLTGAIRQLQSVHDAICTDIR